MSWFLTGTDTSNTYENLSWIRKTYSGIYINIYISHNNSTNHLHFVLGVHWNIHSRNGTKDNCYGPLLLFSRGLEYF